MVACQVPLSMDSPGKNTGVGCSALLQVIVCVCSCHFITHIDSLNPYSQDRYISIITKVSLLLPPYSHTWYSGPSIHLWASAVMNLFSISIIFSLGEGYMNGNLQFVNFSLVICYVLNCVSPRGLLNSWPPGPLNVTWFGNGVVTAVSSSSEVILE